MSDSDDSESFLSADEGGADDGNESSDITLSSDSEPDEEGKAAPGDPDSSDITLSSDDDDKGVNASVKSASKGADGSEVAAKGVEATEGKDKTKTTFAKGSDSADADGSLKQQKPSPELRRNVDKSALSSPVTQDVKQPYSEQDTTTKTGPANTSNLLESTELSSDTEKAKTILSSNTSASPVNELPLSQASQVMQSQEKAPAPATLTAESKDVCAPHVTPTSTNTSDPDTAEGWGDFDEDLTLPDVPAAGADVKTETFDGVGTGDTTQQSTSRGGPTQTKPREKTPPPSESAAPAVTRTSPRTAHSPPEHSRLPPEPDASPPEPAASRSEPDAPKSEPGAPTPEPTAPESEPAAPTPEPTAPKSEPAPERRRLERRERRGPLKLGAKKLGTKLATPATQPVRDEAATAGAAPAAGGGGEPQTAGGGGGGAGSSRTAPAATFASQEEQDGWGGWETWGSSLLSSAAGVTKTVLETVETGFGAPDPEDLARVTRQEREEQERRREQERQVPSTQTGTSPVAADPAPGLGSWFGGVSRVLGQTSSLVVNTGLDTLEAIGKKTMTVLQDDQLGIHDTISQLGGGQKPSLSQALREARERRGDSVPCSPAASSADRATSQPPTFSHMFDRCDGTVHLEALEMLSARCRSRVTAAKGRVDEAAGIVLDMVEDLCTPDELQEVEVTDFERQLSSLVARLSVPIKPTRLVIAQSSASQWLSSPPAEPAPPRQVLTRAVRAAAEMGAGLAEFLHKLAELRLVESTGGDLGSGLGSDLRSDLIGDPGSDPVTPARHLAALAALVSAQAGTLAAGFAEKISDQRDERAAAATTDIYLEVSYVQKFCCDSLNLMAPVVQVAALNDKS